MCSVRGGGNFVVSENVQRWYGNVQRIDKNMLAKKIRLNFMIKGWKGKKWGGCLMCMIA